MSVCVQYAGSAKFDKMGVRVAVAKEVGMGNPAGETIRSPGRGVSNKAGRLTQEQSDEQAKLNGLLRLARTAPQVWSESSHSSSSKTIDSIRY